MKIKLILPALDEAKSPLWRPLKYSLFPPLGLATLAGHIGPEHEVELVDQHVETLRWDDQPDLVVLQVYITSARKAYAIADHYRARGSLVVLGGLHVTSLPEEARQHADVIFLGPGDESFPRFLRDWQNGAWADTYTSQVRQIDQLPAVRRDLIKRHKYLVPNSLVVSRGCPHDCDFCYKSSFFAGGKSFYFTSVDQALNEIEGLPGRHLYFLDDHLFGSKKFAGALFDGMAGMNRVFQAAATVESVLADNLVEKAQRAGLRSLFLGFETFSETNLLGSNKRHNLKHNYELAVQKLHSLGIKINGSFVFGMDDDGPEVFRRTVDWAVRNSLTTATFHIMTPYPGTELFKRLEAQQRIVSRDWDRYNTREVVYQPQRLTAEELKAGYDWAYKNFYSWSNLFQSSFNGANIQHPFKQLAYMAGWKKFEPFWNLLIKMGLLGRMLPFLETVLDSPRQD